MADSEDDMRTKFTKHTDEPKLFMLKAQNKDKSIMRTYRADTKTDCMYKFDKYNHRRGFRFFMVKCIHNVYIVEPLERDYPYQQHILE